MVHDQKSLALKSCRRCGLEKRLDAFWVDNSRPDGLQLYCKECLWKKRGVVPLLTLVAGPGEKYCPICKSLRPFNDFHKSSSTKSGLSSGCKNCLAFKRSGRPPRKYPIIDETKERYCPKCEQIKFISAFHDDKSKKTGKSRYCYSCRKAAAQTPENIARRKAHADRYRNDNPVYSRLYKAVKSGKVRGRHVDLTVYELMALYKQQEGKCALTGIEMTFGNNTPRGGATPLSCSVDRIDQSVGYTIKNVRLVCFCVNAFRGIMSDDQMIAVAKALVEKADSNVH